MPWVNLDDQFPDHPKVAGLSDAAFRLHIAAICYCNRYLTDGVIDRKEVRKLVRRYSKKTVDELVSGGHWYDHNGLGVYELHDFLQWNRSREEVREQQERLHKVRSEAGKKGARARWGT